MTTQNRNMSNLKPFNLEEALAGKPVVTRDGRKVTEIYHFKTAIHFPQSVAAIVSGNVCLFNKTGRYWLHSGDSDNDLFMAPESIEVWVNVWRQSNGQLIPLMCRSEESAEQSKLLPQPYTFIKTEKFTINL